MRKFVVGADFEGQKRKCAYRRVSRFRFFCFSGISNISNISNSSTYTFSYFKSRSFLTFASLFIWGALLFLPIMISAQTYQAQFAPGQTSSNYLKNSQAFRQEVMRMEINVTRGDQTLPITQVPRVQKDDVIKMRLLDEAVGGIKPDQSMWDWTFLVAFVNPNRRNLDKGEEGAKQGSVSEEINFRKSGWYKEYSFTVPYDSQPVFFLYPKPKYRQKILSVINKKFSEVQKLGEKTIEIAGAYAQIDSFLNELQYVMYQTQYSRYANNSIYGSSSYGSYYNPYGYYNPYNPGGSTQQPDIPFNYNAFIEQTIERLARSFNIQMPQCWQNGGSGYSGYNNYGTGSIYNPYGSYGTYNSYGSYGTGTQNSFGYQVSADLINRAQCLAKNIRIEDFDFSVSQLLKQGGIMLATQLRDKYPQLAYWINLAAVAVDFIVKVFQKSPLRIVPTIIQSSDGLGGTGSGGYGNMSSGGYGNSYQSSYQNTYSPNSSSPSQQQQQQPVKISLYAESQPGDANGFVTAYPIVVQKWQANPDPNVISIPPPVSLEPCLHQGVNILKSASITDEPTVDNFSRDFKLVMSSENGFRKEFPLKKNQGLGGWELNLTQEDINSFPKINMVMESEIVGTRGFNEIKSPKFSLAVSFGGNNNNSNNINNGSNGSNGNNNSTWQLKSESQKAFSVGGRRRVTLINTLGSCRCLQSVTYKPSFGGQFVFVTNAKQNGLEFSADGREVSFELDASQFQPGQGQLEMRTFGGEMSTLNIKLYPLPPNITDVKISKGDRMAILTGERLEQLQSVKINGKRAIVVGNNNQQGASVYANSSYPNQNQYPNQNGINSQNQSQAVNQTSNPVQNLIQNLNLNLSPNQRAVVFEDQRQRQTAGTVSLELGLEEDRSFGYPQTFTAGASRPMIAANDQNEIEGVFIKSANGSTDKTGNVQIDPNKYPIVTIDAAALSIVVQNKLTDYEFKGENLSIETRIERSQPGAVQPPQVGYDVLDGNTLRLNFTFNEQSQKFIGGRRLQFRIRDRERGDSDWYTIRQTFVRLPEIKSVKCTTEMNGMCQMTGDGIDYIQQVSVDGGQSWYPQDQSGLIAQPTADGQKTAMIPLLVNKKLLQIKLRDFPNTSGLPIVDFLFSSSVKPSKTSVSSNTRNVQINSNQQNSVPVANQQNLNPALIQNSNSAPQNQPVNSSKPKPLLGKRKRKS